MNRLRTVLLLAATFFFSQSQANWGFNQTFIIFDDGGGSLYYGGSYNPYLAPLFSNHYYGNFNSTSTFNLDGGYVISNETGSSNVCGSTLYYRVYRSCDAPGAFNSVSLGTYTNLGGGDESWENTTAAIDLLSGIVNSGTYVVEAYWALEGNLTNPVGCGQFVYDYNSGSYWKGYFDFDVTDSFTDSNLSSSPTWSGDTGNWQVVSNSDVSSLTGSELLQSRTLRLNVFSGAGTQYLSTPITNWDAQQQWSFWMGRRSQAATSANRIFYWLYANEANLESGTVDGYRLAYGDDVLGDELVLQSVTNGVATTIISGYGATANGINDYGFTVKVTRSQSGVWTVHTSTLPVASGTGATANSCPVTDSNVLQGSAVSTTYTPSGTGYMGVVATHTSGLTSRFAAEIDNIRFEPLPPNTELYFNTASSSVNEDDGTYNLTVDIANPSATYATQVDVVLVYGDGTRVNNFTSQTLNFPANSGASQAATITITDNLLCDDFENLTFELQNATGGLNAFIGSPFQHAMTISDDNTGYGTTFIEDFETNDISAWASYPAGFWESSSLNPASGIYSLRSSDVNVAGHSSISYNLDDMSMSGVVTTWRFNIRYAQEPSVNNKFMVFLSANEEDTRSATVDGYAVGVNPSGFVDPDNITLWEITNGAVSSTIIASGVDWGSLPHNEVGFEITRDETGTWELKIDQTGDFDGLVSYGSANNITYIDAKYFGVNYLFTSGLDNAFALDDISITDKACRTIYYSQSSGDAGDAIWDDQPVGVGGTIYPGKYTRLVIQNGHTVTLDANLTSDDLTIANGGILDAASYDYFIYGVWINNGTFIPSTGNVTFKGLEDQSIAGTAVTSFYDLTIDNDGGTVLIVGGGATTIGVVTPDEGTLDANGKLTLLSSAGGTSSIGEISPLADVIGNLTLQRYVPSWTYNGIGWNQGGTWVNLGNPLQGSLTLADWNDDMITTGFVGSDYPPPYNFVNVTTYDESVPGNRNLGYVNATNITNPLLSDDGYFVFLTYAAHTIDVTGTIQKNGISHYPDWTNTGSGSNDGWNLVTNRYPSEVDWVLMVNGGVGVSSFHVYDRDLPGYRVYNGLTQVGTGSRYIPSGQSFLTQAYTTGDYFQYEENVKSNTNYAFERSRPESSFISMRIEKDGMADEAVVVFREGSVPAYENLYDGLKLENVFVPEAPELAFTASGDELLSIYSVAHNSNLSVPVWIDAPSAGTYNLLVNEIQNLPSGACMVVHDMATNEDHVIENGMNFTFEVNEAFSGVRFMLGSTSGIELAVTDAACNGSDGTINVTATGDWTFEVFNDLGESLFSVVTENMLMYLPAGTYVLETENASDVCGAFTNEFTINEPAVASIETFVQLAACNMLEGIIEFAVDNAGEYSFELLNSNGEVIQSGTSSDIAMQFTDLEADVYELNLENSCGTLTSSNDLRDPASVIVDIVAPAEIAMDEQTEFVCESYNAESLQWSINGEEVATGEVMNKVFNEEGLYLVEVLGVNSPCSDTDEIMVDVKAGSVDIASEIETSLNDVIVMDYGFDIVLGHNIDGKVKVEVFNMAGQRVFKHDITNAAEGRHSFEVKNWANGAYTVRISSGDVIHLNETIVIR